MPTRANTLRRRPLAPLARWGLACLAAFVALAGCEPYVEGNGVLGEEVRTVPAFGGLAVEDGIQAVVAAGAPERSVLVKGDENVLRYVATIVEERAPHGPVLIVRIDEQYQSTNALQVVVGAAAPFAYVVTQDASPVNVTGAAAEVFTVEASGGSHVALEGAGGARLVATLSGGGARLDARGYPVAEADVAISGGASVALHASASVEGTAAGTGSRVENAGDGVCEIAASDGAQVVCVAP